MTVRTRFAPSPTGYLHVGGARTALYSWLYARKHGGVFILRIEDTDRERSTDEAVNAILEAMAWLGLNYDAGPYYQTKHFDRYHEVLQELMDAGQTYRCYCSKERLETLRQEQLDKKLKPRYDGRCRYIVDHEEKNGEPYVIRFRNPQEGGVTFDDLIKGKITIDNSELDDLILARSDGTPTYNFTVVVDDMDMGITHVIRGDDHINNTPRQINIFTALEMTPPRYGHVPMILGSDGKRLSKRHGAVSVMQYRDEGYLPQALLNYLVRLGWSYGDQEIFSIEEMIQLFDVEVVNGAPAAFNPEKLTWLNQHYMKTLPREEVAKHLLWHIYEQNIPLEHGPELTEIVAAQSERCKTLKEMAEKSRFFYEEFKEIDLAAREHLKPEIIPALKALHDNLEPLNDWTEENIHAIINKTAEDFSLKLGKLAQPLRVAVTGGTVSPSIDVTLKLIGKTRVLKRLKQTCC